MNILMLFGSQSDEFTYGPLMGQLSYHHQVELKIISAHRAPDELAVALKTVPFDCVLAGAGLAAHLPGVCASKTLRPVFGLPVDNQLAGLDALLSVLQMPPGIPVLTAGVGQGSAFVQFLKNWSELKERGARRMNVVGSAQILSADFLQKDLARIKEMSVQTSWPLHFSSQVEEDAYNICLIDKESAKNFDFSQEKAVQILVPILPPEEARSMAQALPLFTLTSRGGVWVGINNLRNAFLGSVQLLNVGGEQDHTLLIAKQGGKK